MCNIFIECVKHFSDIYHYYSNSPSSSSAKSLRACLATFAILVSKEARLTPQEKIAPIIKLRVILIIGISNELYYFFNLGNRVAFSVKKEVLGKTFFFKKKNVSKTNVSVECFQR